MNQVMRFYAQLPEAQRPRVLGLTASPVHGMGAPAHAIAQLESNLFCKVCCSAVHFSRLSWAGLG